jgi:hypothetical protein
METRIGSPVHVDVEEVRPSQRVDPGDVRNDVPAERLRNQRRSLQDSCVPISRLHMYLLEWKILAKIVKKFPITDHLQRTGQSTRKLVIILKDSSGSEIRGVFYNTQADAWFQALQENETYVITGGTIKCVNEGMTPALSHEYEIVFDASSDFMQWGDELSIGDVVFDFRALSELKTMSMPRNVDILGYVFCAYPIAMVNTRIQRHPARIRRVEIADMSGVRIELALWDDNAALVEDDGKVILAVKDARLSNYRRRSLQAGETSIVLVNPEFEQAKVLKQWINARPGFDFEGLESLTDVVPGINRPIHTLFLSQIDAYELGSTDAGDYFTTFVMCANVICDRHLEYPACPNPTCFHKALEICPDDEGNFTCPKCRHVTCCPNVRYRFKAYVTDFSGSALVNIVGDDDIGSLFTGTSAQGWVTATERGTLQDRIKRMLLKQYFKPLKLRCRAQKDKFTGGETVKIMVMSGNFLTFAHGAKLFSSEIHKYDSAV